MTIRISALPAITQLADGDMHPVDIDDSVNDNPSRRITTANMAGSFEERILASAAFGAALDDYVTGAGMVPIIKMLSDEGIIPAPSWLTLSRAATALNEQYEDDGDWSGLFDPTYPGAATLIPDGDDLRLSGCSDMLGGFPDFARHAPEAADSSLPTLVRRHWGEMPAFYAASNSPVRWIGTPNFVTKGTNLAFVLAANLANGSSGRSVVSASTVSAAGRNNIRMISTNSALRIRRETAWPTENGSLSDNQDAVIAISFATGGVVKGWINGSLVLDEVDTEPGVAFTKFYMFANLVSDSGITGYISPPMIAVGSMSDANVVAMAAAYHAITGIASA